MDVRKMPAKRLPKELVGAVMSVLKGVPVEDVLERIPKRKVAQSKGGKGCKAEYETVVKKYRIGTQRLLILY